MDRKALDGTVFSRDVRRFLVLANSLSFEWKSWYFEAPHFGGDDDAEILKSYVTVHEACAIASNASLVTNEMLALEEEVEAMGMKLKELEEQVAALTVVLTS